MTDPDRPLRWTRTGHWSAMNLRLSTTGSPRRRAPVPTEEPYCRRFFSTKVYFTSIPERSRWPLFETTNAVASRRNFVRMCARRKCRLIASLSPRNASDRAGPILSRHVYRHVSIRALIGASAPDLRVVGRGPPSSRALLARPAASLDCLGTAVG